MLADVTTGAMSRSTTTRVKSSSGLSRAIQPGFRSQCRLKQSQKTPPPLPITMIDWARGAIASTRYGGVTAASYRSRGVAATRFSPLGSAAARISSRITLQIYHKKIARSVMRLARSRENGRTHERARPHLNCSAPTHDKSDQKQHEEDVEKNLRDARGGAGNSAEAENSRDDRDDQKN